MKPQVLIFDGQPMVAEATALALKTSRNLSALTAESGEQAIDILRTKKIDVLLFSRDPLTLESCKFVRALKSDPQIQQVPIVICSRMPRHEAASMFRQAGIDFEKDIAVYVGADSGSDWLSSVVNEFIPRPPQRSTSDGGHQQDERRTRADAASPPSNSLVRFEPRSFIDLNEEPLLTAKLGSKQVRIEMLEELERILPVPKRASEEEMERRRKAGELLADRPEFKRTILLESLSVKTGGIDGI